MDAAEPQFEPSSPSGPSWRRLVGWLVAVVVVCLFLAYLATTARVNGEPIPGSTGYLIGLLLTLVFVFGIVNAVLALTVHAFAQAFTASQFGDPTPRQWKRLSMNPFRHFDLLGWILFLSTSVGWPKVVPISGPQMRPWRLGWVVTAAAGPIANLVLATIAGLILLVNEGFTFAEFMIHSNLMLAIFSLIPIPPLAGFSIVYGLVPRAFRALLNRYWTGLWRYGPMLLAAIVIAPYFVDGMPTLPKLVNHAAELVAPLLGGYEVVKVR